MNFIQTEKIAPNNVNHLEDGQQVRLRGCVQHIRAFSWGAFLILRGDDGFIQTVVEDSAMLKGVSEGCGVVVEGKVRPSKVNNPIILNKAVEIGLETIEVLSSPAEPMPFDINKKEINLHMDVKFDHRPLALRQPRERAIFKVASALTAGFRDYLMKAGFTEIHTPKLCSAGAEGGANIFEVDYFGRKAFLAQSPQFYKQMGVGIYNRVFEVAPVFRAEKHATSRHMNEYISMDYEFGPIECWTEVMSLQADMLASMMQRVENECAHELGLWNAAVPVVPDRIPVLKLHEAHELVKKHTGKDYTSEPDLAPEEEGIICELAAQEMDSEFIFITHFPEDKRPFYTMNDPENPGETLSFDLLFRGLEITTGGQRIHDYDMQVEKIKKFGLSPEDFEGFLQIHRHGMPPHGGLAIGLERLTARILGIANVKECGMYPRDVNRLTP